MFLNDAFFVVNGIFEFEFQNFEIFLTSSFDFVVMIYLRILETKTYIKLVEKSGKLITPSRH